MIFKYSPRSLDPTGNRKIPLGKQGENKRMTLVFDVREWMDEYPEAELAVYVKPPEGEAYLAGIDKEQKGVYRWDITASDTAKAGEGMIELVMRDEATGTVHKSITAKTMIMPSISAEAPGDIPEAHVPWWERALALIEIGVSPEVVVTEIEGGHRVEITDEKGLHTFDVMDGVDGKDANKNLLDGTELNSLRMKEATVSFRNAIALNAGTASYAYAHAEGHGTASGFASHAEGYGTASGSSAHAEGMNTVASGIRSHAEGFQTVAASDAQHAQGKCNVEDADGRYAHIVGNGRDIHNRSNAHTLDWDGNAWFAGDVYVGGKSQDDAEKLVKESAIPEVIEDALAQAKASGEFDGKDGAPGAPGKDGYTPIKGVDYFDGADGKDGYTPVKGVDYFDGEDGKDGDKGDPGADGFSPTVTLTRESDGVTIKATNKSGTSTAKVYDGKDGTGGGTSGGLPTGEAPYQQLVTDAYGNAVWEDKPFGEQIGVILPETEINGEGENMVTLSMPIVVGESYTVMINGTAYECVAAPFSMDGVPAEALGDANFLLTGELTPDAPAFVLLQFSGMTAAMMLDGSTSMVSISGKSFKKLDPKYIDLAWMAEDKAVGETIVPLSVHHSGSNYENLDKSLSQVLTDGKKLVVFRDDQLYETTLTSAGEFIIGGNASLINETFPNTGEPFYFMITGEFIHLVFVTSDSCLYAIYEPGDVQKIPVKLPEKYAPNGNAVLYVETTQSGSADGVYTPTKTYEEILMAYVRGYQVVFRYAGKLHYLSSNITKNGSAVFTAFDGDTMTVSPDSVATYTKNAITNASEVEW